MRNFSHASRAIFLGALCLIVAGSMNGCNIIAPVAFIMKGPPTKEAEYQLEDRKTVVFVDDRQNSLPRRGMRIMIGDHVTRQLEQRDILTDTITTREALLAVRGERASELMPVEEIGRAAGADQVIYIQMTGYTPSVDSIRPRPAAWCLVKVIDITNRTRVYPGDENKQGARAISIVSPEEFSEELYRSSATRRSVEDTMAGLIGLEISKLFYKHEVRRQINTTLSSG